MTGCQSSSIVLQRACEFYQRNHFKDVLVTLKKIPDYSQLNSRFDQLLFLRLEALSLPHVERYLEAESCAKKGLEIDSQEYDFYFVLAYIAIMMKEYDRAIEFADCFAELSADNKNEAENEKHITSNSRHLIFNYLGIAYRQKNDIEKAQKAFEKAIEIAPWYDHPYVNLTNLLIQSRQYEKADDVIERGLKKCSQVHELRILKKSSEHRTTVSACMIVRNEEENLPTCLESIRNWVDEIIVVDTGSSDRTVEIAESYGARIFNQPWEGDFSKARNFSIAQATKDWIFIIDADEEFVQDDIPLLRQVMAQDKYRLVSINVYNMKKQTGEYTSFLPSFRLYKRDAGFFYDGIVHNQLKFDRMEPSLRIGIRLKHYGYSLSPERMKGKLARSRELLEKQLETTPDDGYVHFNYAQLLRSTSADLDQETCELIIKHATRAIELTADKLEPYLHVHLMSHHQLITTFLYQKRLEEAEKLCFRALELKSDYLDPILSLGHIYSHMKKLDKAEEYFRKYLDMQAAYDESQETTNLILLYIRARHIAYYGLGLIKQFQGQIEMAEDYFHSVLSEYGHYLDTHLRLARLYMDRGEMDKGREQIEEEITWHPASDIGHLYMGEYLMRNIRFEEAEESFEKSLECTKDNPEVYEKIGCFYANRREFDRAAPLFEKLVDIKPRYPNGLKLLAKTYYDLGSFEKSMKVYQEYLEMNPEDAEALVNMANCYFKLNDFPEAEKLYHNAMLANENLAAIYRNLGLTKLRLGKATEALSLLEKYIEISPLDLEIRLAMGSIYCKLGSYGEAIPHIETYLSGNPGDIEGLFKISECYYQLGHLHSALIGYNQVLKIHPNHEPARNRVEELHSVGTPA